VHFKGLFFLAAFFTVTLRVQLVLGNQILTNVELKKEDLIARRNYVRYAKDRHGQWVDAYHAVPGRQYWCPMCGAPCHLRVGTTREPHFAHNAGYASADCDWYHPGTETAHQCIDDPPSQRSLDLYVSCKDISGRDGSWQLFLLIPAPEVGTGMVEVAPGYRGTVSLPLSQMHGGGRVHVRPQDTPYQLRVRGLADPNYVKLVERPIQGLNRDCYTVFRFSPVRGRRLKDDQPLYWGRGYVLVWPDGYEQGWWPRLVSRYPMRPDNNWQCCVVELPAEEDAETELWAQNVLGRTVIKPPAILTLTSPIPTSWLDGSTLIVPAGSEGIVGIFGEPGAYQSLALAVEYPGGIRTQEIELPRRLPVLVSLGRLEVGWTEVWLPGHPDVQLSLYAVPAHAKQSTLPSVTFHFQDPKSDHRVEVPLFSTQLADWFQKVANGHLRLTAVSLPERATGFLRFRSIRETVWNEIRLMPLTGGTDKAALEPVEEFAQRVLDEIRARLVDSSGILQIDFGNFGLVTVDLTERQRESKTYSLLPEEREYICWLLSLPYNGGPVASGESVRLLYCVIEKALQHFEPNDKDLLRRVLRRSVWPAVVEPYLRGVTQAIHRHKSVNQKRVIST